MLLTLVTAGVSTSLGLLLATLVKSKQQAGDMGTFLGFVLGFAGGAIPIAPLLMTRMEGTMGGHFPVCHACQCHRGVFQHYLRKCKVGGYPA